MHVAQASPALVAWGNAWLSGHVGLDEATDAIERVNGQHVVTGIPGESGEVPLRRGLGCLRVAGMSALKLALPAPGDLLGLTGPPELNTAALEAGGAALVTLATGPVGLVPAEDRRGSSYIGVRWNVLCARPGIADVPSLPEADHQLSLALRDATDALLLVEDVSDWRPEMAEALTQVRESHRGEPTGELAPGYPARAHRVAALAGRLAMVVDLARRVESEGLTADQMRRRADALRLLDRAVRRARVAAHNSAFDPVP
ncbi:hypothetical protein [Actinomadura sp. HBU206391]|uniref:hypothetical protein n=1 Tax=Actinomadura sp. HBU206391 TaxID=2731692 RepID=UPI00165017C6|nr:hypothetical protein [Actinomadura sp. HBU206391]MBC6459572.1 hypothetical protein [Actinomadura sp. HBU206391]